MTLHTPVALIFFNRPEPTRRVFEKIAEARPTSLFLIADGPREGVPEDVARCASAREVVEAIDWPCEVHRCYAEENLGCGLRPASGIDWLFTMVEEAIILEDDCVPDPTFFLFCSELLSRYRDDDRVVQIASHTLPRRKPATSADYFFSVHNLCIGAWATWRRAWRSFDMKMQDWPSYRDTDWLDSMTGDRTASAYWRKNFERIHAKAGEVTSWDYQWTYACWKRGGLTALPYHALASNIGFGPDATHTKSADHMFAYSTARSLSFPLRHPETISVDAKADRAWSRKIAERPWRIRRKEFWRKAKRRVRALVDPR